MFHHLSVGIVKPVDIDAGNPSVVGVVVEKVEEVHVGPYIIFSGNDLVYHYPGIGAGSGPG